MRVRAWPRFVAAGAACALAFLGASSPARADALVDLDLDALGAEGYGGPIFKLTRLDGRPMLLGGGSLGSVFVDRHFGLGVAWNASEGDVGGRFFLTAGLRGEWRPFADLPVEPSFALTAGAGTWVSSSAGASMGNGLVVFEPEFVLAAPLSRSLRLALHVGYRAVAWRTGGTETPLDAPYAGLALQYGVFGPPGEARGDAPRWQLSGFVSEKITVVCGELAWLDGGGTRVVLMDERLAVGATGYTMHRTINHDGRGLGLGYGGVEGAWTFSPRAVAHLVVGGVVAVGGAQHTGSAGGELASGSASSTVLFLEPEVFIEINAATFLRVALGATWRQAVCFSCAPDLGAWDLSGPSGVLQLRFGWFE